MSELAIAQREFYLAPSHEGIGVVESLLEAATLSNAMLLQVA